MLKRLILLSLIALQLASVLAHLYRNADSRGFIAILDRVFDFGITLCLAALMIMVGRTIARWFGLKFGNTAEDFAFSFFLGTGVLALSVLFLGLLGLLRPWPTAILILIYIAIVARDLPNFYTLVCNSFVKIASSRKSILSLLFVCMIVVFALRAATPLHIGDEAIYHLPVPREFINEGRVFPNFNNSLGNFPFLIQMVYALFLMADSDIAPKLFSLLIAVFTSLGLYGFCARYLTQRVGLIALFGFFAAGMVVEVAVTARIDVSLAGMLFMATYAMINFIDTERSQWLLLSAVLSGFSLGIKHSAGGWLVLLTLMFLIESLRKRRDIFSAIKQLFVYAFISLAIASPWYIKNAVWFHNPVYPLITGEVAEFGPQGLRYFTSDDERRLDAHFEIAQQEIPEVVKQQEAQLADAVSRRPSRHPLRFWEFFLKPNTYLMSEPFHFPNYMFLIIPLLLFVRRQRWVMWLLGISLVFVFSVTYASWMARFLLPAFPPLTIVASYTLSSFCDQLNSRASWTSRLPAWVVVLSLSVVVIVSAIWIRTTNGLQFLTGRMSRREFLTQLPYYRPFEFINSNLPADVRIMLLGVQPSFDLERDYLTDETWFTTKWRRLLVKHASLEEVNDELKRQKVTHIFYCPGLFTYAARTGVQGAGGMQWVARNERKQTGEANRLGAEYVLLRNWATFTLYSSKFLETVYTDEDCQVFRVK